MIELYERYLRMREKYLEGAPGAQKAIKRLFKEMEEIKTKYGENKNSREMLENVLKRHLERLETFSILLKSEETNEGKLSLLNKMLKSTESMYNVIGVLSLDGTSREELDKDAESVILEGIGREHSLIYNDEMQEEKIGLHLRYNKLYGEPIKIYANKAAIEGTWSTLLDTAFTWAPHFSTITQVFRINKANNLEMIIENTYAEKRSREPKGLEEEGIRFVKDFVKKMCGSYETYKSTTRIPKDYDVDEWGGSKKGGSLNKDNTKIHGVRITIPMKELTSPIKK